MSFKIRQGSWKRLGRLCELNIDPKVKAYIDAWGTLLGKITIIDEKEAQILLPKLECYTIEQTMVIPDWGPPSEELAALDNLKAKADIILARPFPDTSSKIKN